MLLRLLAQQRQRRVRLLRKQQLMHRPQVHMLRQPQVLQRSLRLHHRLPVPHQLRTVLLVLRQVLVQWPEMLPKQPAPPLLKQMRCIVRRKLLSQLPRFTPRWQHRLPKLVINPKLIHMLLRLPVLRVKQLAQPQQLQVPLPWLRARQRLPQAPPRLQHQRLLKQRR